MHKRPHLLLAIALALPASVFGAPPQGPAAADRAKPVPASSERRLTPAEIDRILDDAAARREAADLADLATRPKIFGEVGLGIGTGGYRSAFGSAYVPLDDGFASFTFSTDRASDRVDGHTGR